MTSTTSAMTQPARRRYLPGYMVVIICSITIQPFNIARSLHLEHYTKTNIKIESYLGIGLLFLSYPLLGYIADVCLTRYRTLKCSITFLIVGCIILLVFSIIIMTVAMIFPTKTSLYKDVGTITIVGVLIAGVLINTGVGLFEANAIQFGLDQLLEAPTPKLIAFIHWYYWTQKVVQLAMIYITAGYIPIGKAKHSLSHFEDQIIAAIILLTFAAVSGVPVISSLVQFSSRVGRKTRWRLHLG